MLNYHSPRYALSELSSADKTDKNHVVKLQIFRAKAAEANGFENLPVFAGAVLAANVAGVPVETLNALSAAYLASRVIYNIIYVVSSVVITSILMLDADQCVPDNRLWRTRNCSLSGL